jgi:hypothetical protein
LSLLLLSCETHLDTVSELFIIIIGVAHGGGLVCL